MRRIVIAIAAVLMLSGCAAAPPGASPEQPKPGTPAEADADAVDLIGLWRVSDAAGETPDTWLRLDDGEVTLWRECGFMSGSWSALDSVFLADISASHESCLTDGAIPVVAWLNAAAGYERDGAGWALQSSDGAVVARLAIDGAPPENPNIASFYREQPTVTEATGAQFATVELPSGVVPAASEDLVGRWVPTETFATDPHLNVDAAGTWSGSDGCNGAQGRWASPTPGVLVATSGVMTLIGCEGSSEPLAFGSARAAGFDGSDLVLYDVSGQQVARLVAG